MGGTLGQAHCLLGLGQSASCVRGFRDLAGLKTTSGSVSMFGTDGPNGSMGVIRIEADAARLAADGQEAAYGRRQVPTRDNPWPS